MADYIDRDEIKKFPIRRDHYDKEHGNKHFVNGIETVMGYVDEIPAANVAPIKRGGWIAIPESEISGFNPEYAGRDPAGAYICSKCRQEAVFDCNDNFVLSNFCPNCGAYMGSGKVDTKT